ncbi:indolepyruvate ferredoxin oxidoreductase family protein [uncultured Croceicoccus sp.]|uniref:indolepyruvate ferredoxin oxidoreductase family protein n=1 Tax=uncultured Croceicoccus sp. TaxID=1295329 RepID=UPI002609781F|nr:indolepyruvate ferredoxin oxidoreductase family protein [uncultured Croceicoccus sp.]
MRDVALTDKYTQVDDRVIMSGTHALVRLPLLQKQIDEANGLNTAGFISGYRGSPLGSYDMELWRAKDLLGKSDILFQPGVNEDLAATAVWGTQMLDGVPGKNRDGVFAIWYGKGPGVDRSGDPFKHGNVAGSHPKGGVLLVAGDDHTGKSSTVAHQSEHALIHAGVPILAPSNVQDVLELGLKGWAMSRYTGLFTGFKLCNEVLEQTMTVDVALPPAPVEPERGDAPQHGFHNYPSHLDRLASDIVVKRYRWPLVHKFIRANAINRVLFDAPVRKLGIVATGKAVEDARQALILLGLSDTDAGALGISFLKLGCSYPVEPEGLKDFARGQDELLFVEEKDPITENQAKQILYNSGIQPLVIGKNDENGVMLLPSDEQLEPVDIAISIVGRLAGLGVEIGNLFQRAETLGRQRDTIRGMNSAEASRTPYFCSGCPHNTGTRFPDGSIAAGGIGCHAMAMYSGPEMLPNTQMGGEGAHWYSLAHFTDTPHMFQNMGDGTYYHSGLLAVRGAVAAKVSMTFKILFNDAVAMTGGQPMDGPLSVGDITRQVLAEGVVRAVVVTDRPDLYGRDRGLGDGVTVHHRDDYDAVQRDLAQVRGVTVIVYEQTCAAEKRRRRKRGKFPDPPKRMFINEAVCEGCGDCSVKSNCVSVWPNETELGRKRQIDQSSCNKDYSCVKGFCPSFITVLDAEPRKPEASALTGETGFDLPEPKRIGLDAGSCNIMVSGIGGTGVVTIGALLGMAAHLEGKSSSVFDMTGLSQKNGAVYSHVRIAAKDSDLAAQKLGAGEADVMLAFDAIAALSPEPVVTLNKERTCTVVNGRITPTPAFQRNPDLNLEEGLLLKRLERMSHEYHAVDATGLGLSLLGDSIAANLFMLGYACQLGLLPLSPESILRAVEINGVAIEFNRAAFQLGRLRAVDPERIDAAVADTISEPVFQPLTDLDDIVAHRSRLLTDYQDEAYAARYRALVDSVRAAEEQAVPGSDALAIMVARNFAKLMTYKDEYEVARLHVDPAMRATLEATFQPGARYRYNLAPPLFSKKDPETGELQKREFGPWVFSAFKLLARMKVLRGTAFDPFGYTGERRMERALVDEYEQRVGQVIARLSGENHGLAIEIASVPATIRGYGHIKERNAEAAATLNARLMNKFAAPVNARDTDETRAVATA